jgi:hypothetical protein
MYLALESGWRWVALQLMYGGWTWNDPATAYAAEAARVANESKPREAALSQQHPRAVFQFGVEYGSLSEPPRGSRTPEELGAMRERGLQKMRALAETLNLDTAEPLPVAPHADFLTLTQRLEDDVGGTAARIERVTSTRLRHLFMLGAHAGSELARLELDGDVPVPAPGEQIGRHATLAGVPPALWRPLTHVSRNPADARAAYRAAVDALDRYLAGVPPVPTQR